MNRFLIAVALGLFTGATASAQDIPLSKILVEGEGWKVAAKELPKITFLDGTHEGVAIYQGVLSAHLRSEGKVEVLAPNPRVQVRTYTAVHAYMPYHIDTKSHSIVEVRPKGADRALLVDGLVQPTCLMVWPDGGQLVIGDAGGKFLWTSQITQTGSLQRADRYYSLRVKPGETASGVKAMVMDAGNLLYALTPLGVQVFDPTGRLSGVILPPAKEEMTAITIGGKDADTLFVACGDKIYSRKIQGKAIYTLKKDK